MKKNSMNTQVAVLLGLLAIFAIAGCGGGKSLDNVAAPTDNNAGLTFTEPALVEHTAAQIGVADTTFILTFFGGTNIKTSGATYVGGAACTACHATTADTFATTNHATAAARKASTFAASSTCMNCHTVNGPQTPVWASGKATRTNVNNGAFGLVAVDYSKTATSTALILAAAANPTYGGIQCENCHGPASLHIAGGGDKNFIVTGSQAVAVSTCDVCHDSPTHHSKSQSWRMSGKIDPATGLMSGGHAASLHTGKTCSACHTAEGFIAFTARKAANPAVYAFDGIGGVTDTVGQHNINCSACHDPHKTTPGNPQLRIAAEELCITCHKAGSTSGVRGPGTLSSGTYRAPHHNIQGRVLAGEYGMTADDKMYITSSTDPILSATYTVATKQVTTTSTSFIGPSMGETTCVNCHMYVDATVDRSHSFAPNPKACEGCHAGINGEAIIGKKQADYIANYTPAKARLDLATTAYYDSVAKAYRAGVFTDAQKILYADAKWNLELVDYDGSKGVHNTAYIMKLIDNASAMLTQLGY